MRMRRRKLLNTLLPILEKGGGHALGRRTANGNPLKLEEVVEAKKKYSTTA
jgi:hypothetical protein